MARKVICTACGHENELSSMFCRKCGAKLDLKNVQAQSFKKKERVGLPKTFKVLRVVVILLIVAVAGLLFWPNKPHGALGDEAAGRDAQLKLERLHDAVRNQSRVKVVVTEGEVNAYLARLLAGDVRGEDQGNLPVDQISVLLEAGSVEVFVRARLGPVPLTYTVIGTPLAGGGQPFQFTPRYAYLGHLPMLGGGLNWAAGRVGRVFGDLKPEREVLDHLQSLEMVSGKARLQTPGS
jgi:hypothetical protein